VALEIDVDGAMDEPSWQRAVRLGGFTQYHPVEGSPASQETEVLVFRTRDDLYFGIVAHDSEPGLIRATLAERDNVADSDDYVRIVLDTFKDQRRAYAFTVNPLGIQQDGVWSESTGSGGGGLGNDPVDDNQDFVWESRGALTQSGYQVEVRIPFKSLRFPGQDVQDWGLQILRRIQRDGYGESWAPITAESANRLAQSGTLVGLEGLDPGLFLELNPVTTALRTGTYDAASASLTHDRPDVAFGMNATYGITSNLTLDATYNPDFSQVEADAGQISVNERFPLFFPEKRPFFLEGTELFDFPQRLVYTRSIVDPVAGAKLTGKVGDLGLGYLGAVDQADGDDVVVNLLRLRADVGESSTLGVLYTDRTRSSDVYSRLVGGDARLVFGGRYTITALTAASLARHEAGVERSDGLLLSTGFDRAGRNFMYNVDFQSLSPAFEARNGLLNRVDDASLGGEIRYRWYFSAASRVERVSPFLNLSTHWNHDDFWAGRGLNEWQAGTGVGVGFRGNWGFNLNGSVSGFDFSGSDYETLFSPDGLGGLQPFRPGQSRFSGLVSVNGRLRLDNWQRLRGQINLSRGETPVFQRAMRVPVEVADAWTVDANFLLLPVGSLQAELGARRSLLDRQEGGGRYASATILRARLQYQLTPAFFVRTIGEYNSATTNDLRDPDTGGTLARCDPDCVQQLGRESHELYWEGLLSFEPSPRTVFFLGYSRLMEDESSFAFSTLTPREDGLFVKASYRFRM
jgi:hypothetical protein